MGAQRVKKGGVSTRILVGLAVLAIVAGLVVLQLFITREAHFPTHAHHEIHAHASRLIRMGKISLNRSEDGMDPQSLSPHQRWQSSGPHQIPKLLHQVWAGGGDTARLPQPMAMWARQNPGYTHELWTDARQASHMATHHPDVQWETMPSGQREQLFRCAIVHDLGGVWVDSQVECPTSGCSIDSWLESQGNFFNVDLIVQRAAGDEQAEHLLSELVFGAAIGHPVLAAAETMLSSTEAATSGEALLTAVTSMMQEVLKVDLQQPRFHKPHLRTTNIHIGSMILLPESISPPGAEQRNPNAGLQHHGAEQQQHEESPTARSSHDAEHPAVGDGGGGGAKGREDEGFHGHIEAPNGVMTPKEVGDFGDSSLAEKQGMVKDAIVHSWNGYKKYAWGKDSLLALHRRGLDESITQMGATIIDSLDLLHMIGLKEELAEARAWVEKLNVNRHITVSLFETTIRNLGGLLAAHALTKDALYLTKAVELGQLLLPAFKPGVVPCMKIQLGAAGCSAGGRTSLADAGTLLMEFRELSRASGKPEFEAAVRSSEAVLINSAQKHSGLLPEWVSGAGVPSSSVIHTDAGADSYYEYLGKLWVQGDRTEAPLKAAFNTTLTALLKHALVISPKEGHHILGRVHWNTFLARGDRELTDADRVEANIEPTESHLSCFFPGLLALYGMKTDDKKIVDLAETFMWTCWQLYNRSKTGVGTERHRYRPTNGGDLFIEQPENNLRPEVMESLYYLHRATKKEKYLQWGWSAFRAWERHARVGTGGYCGLRSLDTTPKCATEDFGTQHSFWLGETLKYTWLLFDDGSALPMDQWVFTTEAHPLPISAAHPPVLGTP